MPKYVIERNLPGAGALTDEDVGLANIILTNGARFYVAWRDVSGAPVLAAAEGTILSMRQNTLGGTTLYLLDSQRRFVYYYAHLERYHDRMSQGVEVRQGDVLGFVGTSGNAPRNFPHLHFQALRVDPSRRDWWNGSPVDIRPYFRIAGRERDR